MLKRLVALLEAWQPPLALCIAISILLSFYRILADMDVRNDRLVGTFKLCHWAIYMQCHIVLYKRTYMNCRDAFLFLLKMYV